MHFEQEKLSFSNGFKRLAKTFDAILYNKLHNTRGRKSLIDPILSFFGIRTRYVRLVYQIQENFCKIALHQVLQCPNNVERTLGLVRQGRIRGFVRVLVENCFFFLLTSSAPTDLCNIISDYQLLELQHGNSQGVASMVPYQWRRAVQNRNSSPLQCPMIPSYRLPITIL